MKSQTTAETQREKEISNDAWRLEQEMMSIIHLPNNIVFIITALHPFIDLLHILQHHQVAHVHLQHKAAKHAG